MRSFACLAASALLASGCFASRLNPVGGGPEDAQVEKPPEAAAEDVPAAPDPHTEALSDRVRAFYRNLEGRPLDATLTFENRQLRSFFTSEAAFTDYYASIATQVRDAQLRRRTPERIEIDDVSVEGNHARVSLRMVGRHTRGLRFWEIELRRTDTWVRSGDSWVLSPEKL